MRYVTAADIDQAIPRQTQIWLTSEDPQATTVAADVLEQAVTVAETTVDGYLQGRYRYPLNPDSADLRQIVLALARHWLYARRPEGNDLPEAVKAGQKWALDTLALARDGRYHLSGQTGVGQPSPGAMQIRARAKSLADDVLDLY